MEDNICNSGSAAGIYTNSAGGSQALASYLNAQYAAGANAGNYVFLRLGKDASVGPGFQKYTATTADGAATNNAGSPNYTIWPRITYQYDGLAQFPDTDLDGLPDQWEMQNFNTLTNTATGDLDGDGQLNGGEFVAGTHPNDPNSWFHARSIAAAAGGGVTVKWDSVRSRTYTLLKSGSVNTGWTAASGSMAGTGGELSFTDLSSTTTNRYYRIQVALP